MADRSDDDTYLLSPYEDDASGESESNADVPQHWRRPSPDDAGGSFIPSQYDPSRTKKIYAPKSRELQEWVKELWWRWCPIGLTLPSVRG